MQDQRNARNEDQKRKMELLKREGACLFCPRGMELMEKKVLTETPLWFITENDYPYSGSVVHVIAAPKRHVVTPEDLTPAEVQDLFFHIVPKIKEMYEDSGFGVVFRFGNTKQTGATFEHLHVHFVSGVNRTSFEHKPICAVVGFQKP